MAQSYRTLSSAAVLNNTGVAAGSYGSGSLVPVITVGADGRLTSVSTSAVIGGGGGGASVVVSDTAPASPSVGNIWFDSSKLNTYIYYNDGDSSQWVNATSVNVGSIILPTQTGNSGKFLTTNGSNVSWATFTGYSGSAGYTGSVGGTGYTGSASTTAGYTGSSGSNGYTGSIGVGYAGSAAAGGGTPASVSDQLNSSSGAFSLPKGTTAQRPVTPYDGYTRVNTELTSIETYYNSTWITVASLKTVPNSPTIGTATTVNATSATVSYIAPANNGGATITSYTAVSSPSGIMGVLSQAGSGTITVNGLISGVSYTFTVYATNNIGNSAPSGASNSIITWSVPGAPTIGTATVTGLTTATVSFTAPANNGGTAITQYIATSSPGGVTGTLNQAGSGTITVSGLTPSTSYTFTVRAVNAVGQGAESGASNQITTQSGTPTSVEYLVVAGGGGGGGASGGRGGGGGAGGMLASTLSVSASTAYTVTVGGGGSGSNLTAGRGSNGTASQFASISTTGGGGGAGDDGGGIGYGSAGGSGGGGHYDGAGGAGTAGQGNNGGAGITSPNFGSGGGGGAGAVGQSGQTTKGGDGGIGNLSSITGTSTYYAGGGGGQLNGGTAGSGGAGGGGTGNGQNPGGGNLGGGGGGNGSGGTAGQGGSGVVVIAYPNTYNALSSISGGLTYDQPTRSGYRVYRFTGGTGPISW